MIYSLIDVATMFACCEVRRGLREIVDLVPKKKPIMRHKFYVMTFTKWWTEKKTNKSPRINRRNIPKHYLKKNRSKESRITIKKVKNRMQMNVANAASENDEEDRSKTQKIKFYSDSFPIGIDTFDSCCVSNDIDHLKPFNQVHQIEEVK